MCQTVYAATGKHFNELEHVEEGVVKWRLSIVRRLLASYKSRN